MDEFPNIPFFIAVFVKIYEKTEESNAATHAARLQKDIYLAGDTGAGSEVTERAGQLCPPGEFGMCPPRASCGPGVKVNKGAMRTASSSRFSTLHPTPQQQKSGLFMRWPRPPEAIHTSTATCCLSCILPHRVPTWGQGPSQRFVTV